jgi:hypothetical protein
LSQTSGKGLGHPEAFAISAAGNGVNMRKPDTAVVAAGKPVRPRNRGDASVELVCLALALATFALTLRIASIW